MHRQPSHKTRYENWLTRNWRKPYPLLVRFAWLFTCLGLIWNSYRDRFHITYFKRFETEQLFWMVNICPWVMFLPVFHKDQSLAPFGFQCKPKLFANDTSSFSRRHNISKATNDLNKDLTKITKWAFQGKMWALIQIFLSKLTKLFFSCKRSIASHPSLTFNSIPVIQSNSRNGFGMQLDKKLNFEEYFNKIGPKVNKTIGIFCKLQDVLPRSTLLRPH